MRVRVCACCVRVYACACACVRVCVCERACACVHACMRVFSVTCHYSLALQFQLHFKRRNISQGTPHIQVCFGGWMWDRHSGASRLLVVWTAFLFYTSHWLLKHLDSSGTKVLWVWGKFNRFWLKLPRIDLKLVNWHISSSNLFRSFLSGGWTQKNLLWVSVNTVKSPPAPLPFVAFSLFLSLSSAKIQYGAQAEVSPESTRTASYAG